MSRYTDYETGDDFPEDEDFNENASYPTDPDSLGNNTLAFIALANEYCAACENAATVTREAFVATMLRLLPRIYIAASDIRPGMFDDGSGDISPALDEDSYNTLLQSMAATLAENDTFLEVFEQDMKYSDTPIAATVSENLADIFQVLYDFLETVRDAPNYLINEAMAAVRESFAGFWSQTLTNVLRALNAIKYQ